MNLNRIPIDPPFTGILRKSGEKVKIIAYLPKHPPTFIFISEDGKEDEATEGIDLDEIQTFTEKAVGGRKELNPAIKKKVRKRLQEEQKKIEGELKEAEKSLKKSFCESASQRISSNHLAEIITHSAPALIRQRIENCKKRIKKIKQAFLRLDVFDNYGICVCGCGREIPLSRLMQIPYTSKRADCKEREETGKNTNRRPKRRR